MEILHHVSVGIRRIIGAALVACCALGAAVSTPANALSSKASVGHAVGPKKQVLTASPVSALKSGSVITVTGSGFDTKIGIYVEMCVKPAKGKKPDPCGGGINMNGKNPASQWISSNPPPYGFGLAKPFKSGGKFTIKISVSPLITSGSTTVDCRIKKCAVVTRADHTRPSVRSADVLIPITFK